MKTCLMLNNGWSKALFVFGFNSTKINLLSKYGCYGYECQSIMLLMLSVSLSRPVSGCVNLFSRVIFQTDQSC